MTTDGVDSLDDLSAKVDDEFASHRRTDEFKIISLVIDTSSSDHPTLIVHVDRREAKSLADEIKFFLTECDTYTQREYHSETDIRILAALD